MIRSALTLIIFLFLFQSEAESQNQFLVKKNLQDLWLVYDGDRYVSFEKKEDPVRTIYFQITPKAFKGDFLQIKSANNFSVFVNQQFLTEGIGSIRISLDSLPKQYFNETILVAVSQKREIDKELLDTKIYSEIVEGSQKDADNLIPRKTTYFKDFVITAVLFLFVFFIVMIQLNPRLSSDYFSVNKILSVRENEEDQFYLRITSASILFYAFTSLLLALFLLLIGEISGAPSNLLSYSEETFSAELLVWLKLSLIIFSILFGKTILIYFSTSLFDIRDSAGYHFFNFIRLLLVVATLLVLVLSGYYLLNGSERGFSTFLFNSLGWILGVWIIILFFKLSYRIRFSPIHLFSYICVTEILPFLILVKILYE